MTNSEIKRKAFEFQKEFGLNEITYPALYDVAEAMGYTIVLFHHLDNDEDVQQLINSLHLGEQVLGSRGFTYTDRNCRLIFIHESLTQAEKKLILCHELGHVYCGHCERASIIGLDVQQEHEANEFVHYLLMPAPISFSLIFYRRHRRSLTIVVLFILLLCTAFAAYRITRSHEIRFVTTTGSKYHKEDCIFVMDKENVREVTPEEIRIGYYQPCQVCMPASGEHSHS